MENEQVQKNDEFSVLSKQIEGISKSLFSIDNTLKLIYGSSISQESTLSNMAYSKLNDILNVIKDVSGYKEKKKTNGVFSVMSKGAEELKKNREFENKIGSKLDKLNSVSAEFDSSGVGI